MPAPDLRTALRPKNSIYRAAAVMLRAQLSDSPSSPEQAARKMFGKDHGLDLMLRATSSPATLTTPTWAAVVAHDVIRSELIQRITGLSAAAGLMQRGLQIDLSGVASVTIPARIYNPAAAGDWIGEGQPIMLRQPTIARGPKLAPRKLAVLATFTEEMVRADSIEEFTTAAIREGAAALLDKQMFSTNAGDATHPPGILLDATSVTPSTATDASAISSDIGRLVGALATAGAGLEVVFIAAPAQAAALRFWGFDVLASLALAAGTIVAVEASSFVSGFEGLPEFSTAIGATLHFDDTSPTDITGGTPSPATPVKSLFQDNLIGLRMILRASWAMRNPLHVAVMTGVSW
jgi:hypothetical protein